MSILYRSLIIGIFSCIMPACSSEKIREETIDITNVVSTNNTIIEVDIDKLNTCLPKSLKPIMGAKIRFDITIPPSKSDTSEISYTSHGSINDCPAIIIFRNNHIFNASKEDILYNKKKSYTITGNFRKYREYSKGITSSGGRLSDSYENVQIVRNYYAIQVTSISPN